MLPEYDYNIVHHEGKQHNDGRCKQCGLDEKEEEMDESTTSFCDAVSHLMLSTWTKESFQSADPDIHQIVHW